MDEPLGDDIVFEGPNELDIGLARIRMKAAQQAYAHACSAQVTAYGKMLDIAVDVMNLEKLRDTPGNY